MQVLNSRVYTADLKGQEFKSVCRLSHKRGKDVFIIIYNHYLSKISELKKSSARVKI
jgi:hypothetical protein